MTVSESNKYFNQFFVSDKKNKILYSLPYAMHGPAVSTKIDIKCHKMPTVYKAIVHCNDKVCLADLERPPA